MGAAAWPVEQAVRAPSLRRLLAGLLRRRGAAVPPTDQELLADRLDSGRPMDIREGLSIALDLAGELASHERTSPHPLPIHPRAIHLTRLGGAALDLHARPLGGRDWFGVGSYAAHYLAPEQMLGVVPVDRRTNVYALGAVLYHVFTGRPPQVELTARRLRDARCGRAALPLRALRPDLHLGLCEVVDVCLARDPGLRHDSAHELLQRLLGIAGAMRRRRVPRPDADAG